jgi:ATP-dependent Clp protease ATP-binding subunit ClpA
MELFSHYSWRAKRVIFYARYEAFRESAKSITPEHLLRALLREDPQLFALVAPQMPNLVTELQRELAVEKEDPHALTRNDEIPLAPASKDIVLGTGALRERLGHRAVTTQHLLLSILVGGAKPKGWFGRPKQINEDDHSSAQRILKSHGLTAASVEAATKEGIVTPATWVGDDPILKLSAQLNALAELLVSKKLFSRSEFVQLVDRNEGPITPEAFLLPLIDALFVSGRLSPAEKEKIIGTGQPPDPKDRQS